MSGKFVRAVALGALFAGVLCAPLLAAPVDVVKNRVASFKDIAAARKNVTDALKTDSPQLMIIRISAREINTYAKGIYGWFPAGTGPQTGLKTRAKAEIWTQPAKFKATQDSFVKQAQAMVDAAASGDVARMQAQSQALGRTCSECHNSFRTD